ncbi:hypothetical protein HDU98_011361 [Podochytrium sp. JEL0797]|nr:hypothetical protein HDU98_011361 [Podochytrium sp. JEL0797]
MWSTRHATLDKDIVLISKCGHILADPERVAALANDPEIDAVVLSESAAHCISPRFIAAEITDSLNRLGVDKIDIYMVNCPERLLAGKLRGQKVPSIYPLLEQAFAHLEHEVKTGRIGSYGLASNSIANSSAPDHIDINECVKLAEKVGGKDNAFSCIEYPLNLFERDAVEPEAGGKSLAEIAEENGLYQFTQRPLNAIAAGSIRCLGDKRSAMDDESKITAELTSLFERVTELEQDLSDLVGDTAEDITTVSHFIWAETFSENLSTLVSSNAFATRHYVQTIVLPTLAKDISDLLVSLDTRPTNARAIQAWSSAYRVAIEELGASLVGLCESAEAATNREIASVVSAMAPSAVKSWREVVYAQRGVVDMYAAVALSDLAVRIVRGALEAKTGGRGGTVLVGMRREGYVEGIVVAGSGGSVSGEDVESAFLCSLLD